MTRHPKDLSPESELDRALRDYLRHVEGEGVPEELRTLALQLQAALRARGGEQG